MKSLARAFALFSGASFVGTLTQVAKGKLTAVVLGVEGVGILNQLTSIWSLFSVFGGLGLYNGIVRHLAKYWSKNDLVAFRQQMSSTLILMMIVSLLLTLIGCLVSRQISAFIFDDAGDQAPLICLILLSVPVFVASQVYRGMLSATRSIPQLVRARVFADLASVVVLAVLIFPLGLVGAICAYIFLHLFYLSFTVYYSAKCLGAELAVPSPKIFSLSEVLKNSGYGINGLIAVAVGIATMIIVSRWIIVELGVGSNGMYAMSLKVSTVYLGGITAAAGGFYFPTLAAAKSDSEFNGHVNQTLKLYLYVIPPMMVIIMAGGDLLMYVLFSAEFIPAAALLLFMLPGDLFRIMAETAGLILIVKNRLLASTAAYMTWALIYLGFTFILLPIYGLMGVAIAYFISHMINNIIIFSVVHITIGMRFSRPMMNTYLLGLGLVISSSLVLWFYAHSTNKYFICISFLFVWFILNQFDSDFKRYVESSIVKIRNIQLIRK